MSGISFRDAYGELPVSTRALEIGSAVSIPWYDAETGMREPALWWVRNVCGIFQLTPCTWNKSDAGKTPLAKGGQWDETRRIRDEDQVYQMWAVRPWCNIGVATLANGFLVVDVDPRSGGNHSMLALAEEAKLDLSEVPRDRSPRGDGGCHLWFRLPARAHVKTGTVLDGVDIPWQVPVVPSLRRIVAVTGVKGQPRSYEYKPYLWEAGDPRDLPTASPRFLDLLGQLGRIKGVAGSRKVTIKGREYSINFDMDELREKGIPHGMQNPTVQALSTSMARRGVLFEDAVDDLLKILAVSDQDQREPWTREDLVGWFDHNDMFMPGIVRRAYDFIAGCKEEEAKEQKVWASGIRMAFEESRRKGGQ